MMSALGTAIFIDHDRHTNSTLSGGIIFSPRYNFVERKHFSASVGLPLSFGSVDEDNNDDYYYSDYGRWRFMFDAPLLIELNIGALSTPDNEQRFGGFLGAGMGYHLGPVTKKYKDSEGIEIFDLTTQSSAGPVVSGGFRLNFGKTPFSRFEIRASYMKSYITQQADIYGIHLLYYP
jgi:hypothetical protein